MDMVTLLSTMMIQLYFTIYYLLHINQLVPFVRVCYHSVRKFQHRAKETNLTTKNVPI